jgi:hypothetical protein
LTHSNSSDRLLGADDYLLYLRCPRSLHWRLTGREIPQAYEADSQFPVESDRRAVFKLLRALYPRGRDAADTDSEPWTWTDGADPLTRPLFAARLLRAPFVARPDLVCPNRPDGIAVAIAREATGIKQAHVAECAFIRFCCADSPPERQIIYYVNKRYARGPTIDSAELLVEADVTRRVDQMYRSHEQRLIELAGMLEEDPTLTRFAERSCRRPHSCPVCSTMVPAVEDDHVSTLYRGGQLVRELLGEGITSIQEIPTARLAHPRQKIQKRTLELGQPHVDPDALDAFISSLVYPLFHLDFEAVTMAVPPFDGVRPWEHVPYLYSVHREHSPRDNPVHRSFLSVPGVDQRRELALHLLESVGSEGSIVVYNASFERGILSRLAESFPDLADPIVASIDRIVDLLTPFNEFSFYDHRQRGKVSLKTVLPILTDYDYDDQAIHDGYTANLAYRSLSEGHRRQDADSILSDLSAYCAMDTLAMVHVVRRLRQIAEESRDVTG